MLAVQLFGGTDFADALLEIVPPVVAAFLHGDGAAGALVDDDVADGGAIGERFIHRVLEVVPPVAGPFLHGDGAAGARVDDDVADGGESGERFTPRARGADFLAAP